MKSVFFASAAVALVAASASADTVLQSTNFNSTSGFTLGALSADPTGTVAGQNGWFTYTAGLGGSANWTIANDPAAGGTHGQVLATTAGTTATGNNSTRFAWTDDIANASRPAGETLIVCTYDFYVGGSATSTNRYGAYMYDASGAKILAGATVQNNTGQLYVVGNYNNAGTVGNYSFNTGTSGILARNSWVTLAVTFDMVTGRFQAGFSTNGGATFSLFFVDGAAAGTAVAELDLIGSVNSGTAAQGATTGYYDNINVTSTPAPGALALLGVAGLAGARRRRA
jgi:MYXO-CTERM domain-containing protein